MPILKENLLEAVNTWLIFQQDKHTFTDKMKWFESKQEFQSNAERISSNG